MWPQRQRSGCRVHKTRMAGHTRTSSPHSPQKGWSLRRLDFSFQTAAPREDMCTALHLPAPRYGSPGALSPSPSAIPRCPCWKPTQASGQGHRRTVPLCVLYAEGHRKVLHLSHREPTTPPGGASTAFVSPKSADPTEQSRP